MTMKTEETECDPHPITARDCDYCPERAVHFRSWKTPIGFTIKSSLCKQCYLGICQEKESTYDESVDNW